ncbi:bZIP transcription factor TRAB1 isoform X1 [Amborella trichopoda]|uniref:BZIP domain-containing protein n=2 Tax=Amborella trichopoda TaxID=13333 RepID=W1NE71_AMBTC|nr:bZIP transcription factor TRAB1 isoform X1 [Amborella trichopoda]XP_020517416.1 bZIP transcription factor TRAB1 isoform X1 [Amborella trichopoda]XP_020517479.1 bZIP transcription factor TRAB1 isoform X1 [Amborella trichopoda]ERM93465.1 hypothetical protein AMTR_s00132p00065700 [Amborella trichopoda]|eukprot:XP_011628944.1 bZIP transcription factor TRAB1 isoform X1 [Amborella trichopoda]
MGSHMNFRNLQPDGPDSYHQQGNNSRMVNNNYADSSNPLARQPSVYSLTLDEFQNALGGMGKDFGSMNMDEFLKNIWTAEESQAMALAFEGNLGNSSNNSNLPRQFSLQRQGSLTLPRTLSQKTVDEVWRDLFKESKEGNNGNNAGPALQQRQQTLGEITLEEFLVRAGVVREDTQSTAPNPMNNGWYSGSGGNPIGKSGGLALGIQQPTWQNGGGGLLSNNKSQQGVQQSNSLTNQPTPSQQASWLNSQYRRSPVVQQQQQKQPQNHLFRDESQVGFTSTLQLPNNLDLTNPGMGSGLGLSQVGGAGNGLQGRPGVGMVGIGDGSSVNSIGTAAPVGNGFMHGGGLQGGGVGLGLVGLGGGATKNVAAGSPAQLSSDGLGKSNGDNSSLSPTPYIFSGGLRGRKCSGSVEKVVERRQRRMIKNRESAARSRARKQAYTMELEAEVQKLKEENMELQKKQEQLMELRKNQVLEMTNHEVGPKRCLRRTRTGPW